MLHIMFLLDDGDNHFIIIGSRSGGRSTIRCSGAIHRESEISSRV